jgi:hypothetical protein
MAVSSEIQQTVPYQQISRVYTQIPTETRHYSQADINRVSPRPGCGTHRP